MAITLNGNIIEVRYEGGDPRGNSFDTPWLVSDLEGFAGVTVVDNVYTFDGVGVKCFSPAYIKILDSILLFKNSPVDVLQASDGNIQVGDKIGEKYSGGCIIYVIGLNDFGRKIIITNCYDSEVSADDQTNTLSYCSGDVFEMCKIKYVSYNLFTSPIPSVIKNIQVTEGSGLTGRFAGTVIDNVVINNATRGIFWFDSSGAYIKNAYVAVNTWDLYSRQVYVGGTQTNTLISCICPKEGATVRNEVNALNGSWPSNNKIVFGEEVEILVTDSNGVNIEGAIVRLYDKDENIATITEQGQADSLFDKVTDADGVCGPHDVVNALNETTRASSSDPEINVVAYYSPFILTIEKTGFQSYSSVINIEEKLNLKISLADIPEAVYIDGVVAATIEEQVITAKF